MPDEATTHIYALLDQFIEGKVILFFNTINRHLVLFLCCSILCKLFYLKLLVFVFNTIFTLLSRSSMDQK